MNFGLIIIGDEILSGKRAVKQRGALVGLFSPFPVLAHAGDQAQQTARRRLPLRRRTRTCRQIGGFALAALALAQFGEHDRRAAHFRVDLDRPGESLGGFRVAPRTAQQQAQVVPRFG